MTARAWISACLLMAGCRSTEPLSADHHREALVEGMAMAESMLVIKNTARVVQMRVVPGTVFRAPDRWGVVIDGKEYGGWPTVRASGPGGVYVINIAADPKTLHPKLNRVAHECGRVLLYERGIVGGAEQDKRLKDAGL